MANPLTSSTAQQAAYMRRSLLRAAHLLQQLWYIYHEQTYDDPVTHAEEENDEFHVYKGTDASAPPIRQGGQLYPFPPDLSGNDKAAAMSLLVCGEALDELKEIALWLLKDLCSKVEEVIFETKGEKRRARFVDPNGIVDKRDCLHTVIKATLKYTDEVYAIDMTGAQFGWYEPALPWQMYSTQRIKTVRETRAYDSETPVQRGRDRRSVLLAGVGKGFSKDMEKFTEKADSTAFLGFEDDEYKRYERRFFEKAEESLEMYAEYCDTQAQDPRGERMLFDGANEGG